MPPSDNTVTCATDPNRRIALGLMGACLLLHVLLAADAASRLTVTHDEYWHIPVGVMTWHSGRFDLDVLNPPLARALAALPVVAFAEPVPAERLNDGPTTLGDEFLQANAKTYDFLVALARMAVVLCSAMTGVLLAQWAWSWYGPKAALLALLLWTTEPTVLANAGLATTDLPAALAFTAVLFSTWKWSQVSTGRNAALFGFLLGAAQLVKYTCVLLAPLALLTWGIGIAAAARSKESERPRWRVHLRQWGMALSVSLLTLNAGYLFRASGTGLHEYRFASAAMQGIQRSVPWNVPAPLPRDYLLGVDAQRKIMEGEHPVYLDGRWSTSGFRDYYLKAFWYKLPHAFVWLLGCAGVWTCWPADQKRELLRLCVVLLPVVLLLAAASGGSMQLGLRYVLPAFPFLCLIAGRAACWLDWRTNRLRTVCVLLPAVLLPLSLRHHPHHLTYFNELAGGPEHGGEHLLDSNLDWGQALYLLPKAIEEYQIDRLKLAYFGTFPPGQLGLDYELPQSYPEPAWYAVSVNYVHGRPHVVRDEQGTGHPIGLFAYPYLRSFRPKARLGNAIELYDLRGLNSE